MGQWDVEDPGIDREQSRRRGRVREGLTAMEHERRNIWEQWVGSDQDCHLRRWAQTRANQPPRGVTEQTI